jgi:hypothetical protein
MTEPGILRVRRDGAPDALRHAATAERRRKERIAVERPAQVRGTDNHGGHFEIHEDGALLRNLSASGLMLQLKHSVAVGQRLFILFPVSWGMSWGVTSSATTSTASVTTFTPTRIAVIGVVRRIEGQANKGCCVGVEIVRHRFVYGGDKGTPQADGFQA